MLGEMEKPRDEGTMIVSQQWLPRSVECLRGYTRRQFTQDLDRGVDGRPGCAAPGDGFRDRVRRPAGGWLVHSRGGRLSHFGPRRLAHADRRTDRCLRRHRRRHRRWNSALPGLALVGMMAGVLLLVMGLTGLGAAVKFIPRPVTIGFTNGIALLIASTQIKDFLGLTTPAIPSEFLPRIAMLVRYADTVRWQTVAIAATSLAIILFWPRLTKRIPGSIVALLAGDSCRRRLPLADRNDRNQVRGNPAGLSSLCLPPIPSRGHSPAASLGLHGCPSGSGRKPAVSGGCRWHERRPPQVQCGTGGARRGEYRLANVRRDTRDRRDCPHGDEHSLGRARHRSPGWFMR